ncbi:lytic murein transglycosylase [Pseudothauera nasutitermitis]|nr:lytic murein transglycosylase [Pseudothauera nasutitermitis]
MNTVPASLLAAVALAAALPAHANDEAAFAACLQELRGEARTRGLSAATFDAHAAPLAPDMAVVGFLDAQPEFTTAIWDYLAGLVDDERVADGQAMLREWADTLAAVQARYDVDPATVVAVWGVESNYGRNFGRRPLLQSLATLSCFGRRQAFFRDEMFATLKIIEEGHVDPAHLTGSWAGAFGHTQFMPTTYQRLAVDFDGDGRRDLVGSVPDALASTANFLVKAGWQPNQPWGIEARLPAGFDASQAGRRAKRSLAQWQAAGLTRADGGALPGGDTQAGLILPAGPNGPAFLTLRNFDALFSYNAAESYALAIAHLADRLRGAPAGFRTPWPTDDPGLSRADRREVQRLLIERGHDIGEVDGLLGTNTRRAIAEVQRQFGWEPDGRAGQRLLQRLRQPD